MNRSIIMILFLALVVVGCAAGKQALEDYRLGASTPLEAGEISPSITAQAIAGPIGAIPLVGQAAPTVAILLTLIGTWMRGKKIRKKLPLNANPITGKWGARVGAESLVQNLSNIVMGVFKVGADGSGFKRAWKVGLATALGLGTTALAIPAVRDTLVANPEIAATITLISAIVGGLEKEIQKVMPVAETPPTA